MYLLKVDEIAKVAKDVENEGINYSHLSTDLVDHICCEIEDYMNNGISFTEAYELVKKKFNIKGLRHIQQDTLMLIDKNYRIMKNSMKTFGVLALALMAFGAMFKIMHWPMAGLMLAISFVFLICVFFPALLYVIYRDVNEKKEAIIYIVAYISGSIFIAGVLFKIMHWPFTNFILFSGMALLTYVLIPLIIIMRISKMKTNKSVFLIGLISLIVMLTGLIFKIQHWPFAAILLDMGGILLVLLFIPSFYSSIVKKSEKLRLDFIFGIIMITYFLTFTFLISLSGGMDVNIVFNSQVKSYATNALYFAKENEELKNASNSTLTIELVNQADLINQQIEEIEIRIVQNYLTVNEAEALKIIRSTESIGEIQANVNFLLSENNPDSPLPQLKTDIERFNKLYSTIIKDSLKMNLSPNQIFDTEKGRLDDNKKPLSWEKSNFWNCTPAAAINKLSFWQYNIRLAENKALSTLVINPKSN